MARCLLLLVVILYFGTAISLCHVTIYIRNASSRSLGTTANKGTRGSLVRMTPDVVYYSWADIDTSFCRYLNRYEMNFFLGKDYSDAELELYNTEPISLKKAHSTK